MRTLSGERERHSRERKGWMVTIHDLSGSPVAAASMVTPFELVTEGGPTRGIPIAEATLSVKRGGQFSIDVGSSLKSPVKGFVMASTVEAEGKTSKPAVQVGMQHVTCMPDAALFIALSAAIDLSMDACQLFSHKLRKELCHDDQDCYS